MTENPQRQVIQHLARVFGSQAEVARILQINKSSVWRWTSVPARHHRRLLEEARRRRIALKQADLVA
jgi:hypothetical protein